MPRSIHSIGPIPQIDIGIDVYVDESKATKAKELIQLMPEIETNAYRKGTINFGRMLARYVRRCIMNNTPPPGVSWPAHSEAYLKKYDPKGFWYLSGQMLRSIKLREYNGNRFYFGPAPEEMAIIPVKRGESGSNGTSNLTLIQLARILELGSEAEYNREDKQDTHNDIPPRPLFRPSFKAVGGTERLKKYIISNLRREIKKAL